MQSMTETQQHQLVVTILADADPINGHCICDGWSDRVEDWPEIGARWIWHSLSSPSTPDSDRAALVFAGNAVVLGREAVRQELRRSGEYGGDCEGCGYPLVAGHTRCSSCAAARSMRLEVCAEAHCETCSDQYDGVEGDTAAVERWVQTHVETQPGHEALMELTTLHQATPTGS